MRSRNTNAVADPERYAVGGKWAGVAVVASYQSSPSTPRPFHVRGLALTPKTRQDVTIALTEAEARKLVADFRSFLGEGEAE